MDRSRGRSIGYSEDPECKIFIRNIPIEMEQEGLQNIFSTVGQIESCRIIPTKEPSHTATFGFIVYKNKTSAATAVETFDMLKIGGKYLSVQISKVDRESNSRSYSTQRFDQEKSSTRSESQYSTQKSFSQDRETHHYPVNNRRESSERVSQEKHNDDSDDGFTAIKYDVRQNSGTGLDSQRLSTGRGILLLNEELKNPSGLRPYAKYLLEKKNQLNQTSTKAYNDAQKEILNKNKSSTELVVGERYHVVLTHVTTPSNFYIEQLSKLPSGARINDYLNSYYKNEMAEKKNECHVMPVKDSIRCKIHNLIPANGEKEWSSNAYQVFEMIREDDTNVPLIADVISCEEYQPYIGRIEKIYSIDLIFDNESVIDYLLDYRIAERNTKGVDTASLNLNTRSNSYKKISEQFQDVVADFDNDFQEYYDTSEQGGIAEIEADTLMNMYRSVSMMDMGDEVQNDFSMLISPMSRNKMFNGSFKIFKKRDLVFSVDIFKCGQTFECVVSFVEETKKFFLQKCSRMRDLCDMEVCIQNYASVLLADEMLSEELYMFQANSAIFDVVLVKNIVDGKWHRAIYLEKVSSNDFNEYDSDDNDEPQQKKILKNYYSFSLIDYGRHILIETFKNDPKRELFILPMADRLMTIGSFALQCNLNEHVAKLREKYSESKEQQEQMTNLFEMKFKQMIENQKVRAHVCQLTMIKNELEALVMLYFLPEDARRLALADEIHLKDEKCLQKIPFVTRTVKEGGQIEHNLKLNCVYYIMRSIDLERKEVNYDFSLENDQIEEEDKENSNNFFQQKQSDVQKKPLSEKTQNVDQVKSPIELIKFKPSKQIQLEEGSIHKFLFKYVDESFEDESFYMALQSRDSELGLLLKTLQATLTSDSVSFVTKLNDLKIGDFVEVVFEEQWYRAVILELTNGYATAFFLDYGNTENLTQKDLSEKKLRIRKFYKNIEEQQVFSIDYQAIKCVYLCDIKPTVVEFFERLSDFSELEKGIDLKIKQVTSDGEGYVYSVVFADEDTEEEKHNALNVKPPTLGSIKALDQEVSSINKSIPEIVGRSLELSTNKEYKVCISHLVGINEFYVQSTENLSDLLDNQSRIADLVDNYKPIKKHDYIVGDFVLVRYSVDAQWYKGVIVSTINDSHEVFFVDYGNTQEIPSVDVIPIKDLMESVFRQNQTRLIDDATKVIEFPLQAICCQLKDKRDSVHNKEILKDYIERTESFTLKVLSSVVHELLGRNVEVIRNTVKLYADGKNLDECFEGLDVLQEKKAACKRVRLHQNLLEIGSEHQFTISFISDKELSINLKSEVEELEALQKDINSSEITESQQNFKNLNELCVDDVVLAKFYEEDRSNFNWYRARIQALDNDKITVFYLDYGNSDVVILADICELPDKFASQPQYCYKVKFSGIKAEQETFLEILSEYMLNDSSKIKIVSFFDNFYFIELFDSDSCFNSKIDPDYKLYCHDNDLTLVEPLVKLDETTTLAGSSVEAKEIQIKSGSSGKLDSVGKILEIGSIHEFIISFLDDQELFFNLKIDHPQILKLQDHINTAEVKATLKACDEPEIGDLVLAKFYEEDRSAYSWYRAQILDTNNNSNFKVFYLDYGNKDEGLIFSDICTLPDQFKSSHYPQYCYRVKIADTQIDFERDFELLSTFLNEEGAKFKVVSFLDGYYNVELWNEDLTSCLNAAVNPNYKLFEIIEPKNQLLDRRINKSNIDKLSSEIETNGKVKVRTKSMYVENYQSPFYFCLDTDLEDRMNLMTHMNEYYNSNKTESFELTDQTDYCAVLSEENWYRAQVKKRKDHSFIFYIDYGFEELYNSNSIYKVLDNQFYDQPRYCFGSCLLDLQNSFEENKKTIEYHKSIELNMFDETLEDYFSLSLDDHELIVHSRIYNADPAVYVPNEIYYVVEMFNKNGESLNEMIKRVNDEKKAKKKRPSLIELKMSDLIERPTDRQLSSTEGFGIFTRHIDFFYLFEEKRVCEIQKNVQIICKNIMLEQAELLVTPEMDEPFYNKGNLVFGKYEDDEKWYRCLITNCNKNKTKFEIFFIDMGNTEVVAKCDLLYGWSEKHVEIFKIYEPQALKCKMYGLTAPDGNDFTQDENYEFKSHVANKTFKAKIINYNESEKIYEVTLDDVKTNTSVHDFLTDRRLADYERVFFAEEIEFYTDLIKRQKLIKKFN